jgi:hypothetical protein
LVQPAELLAALFGVRQEREFEARGGQYGVHGFCDISGELCWRRRGFMVTGCCKALLLLRVLWC